VTALRGETAIITCGNHGDVTLQLKADSHLQMGKLIEVVGKVVVLDGGQVSLLLPDFSPVIRREENKRQWC
jgi:hypothetical protein